MKGNTILKELDLLFAKQDIQAVEPYLTKQLECAYAEKDYDTCITIMNELIGFFRDTSRYQKSIDYCEQVLKLMKQLGYEGSLPYATTILNVANAMRAAGHHKESLAYYERVLPIYREHLDASDERFASLYNNQSLLYQEMNDFESAVKYLEQALEIVSRGDDIIKVAITHSNLGASLLQLNRIDEAMEHLEKSLSIHNRFKEKDFHYNAALAAMGQAYVLQGKPEEARACFLEALYEQKKHCGKSETFYRILGELNMLENKMNMILTTEWDVPKGAKKAQIQGLELAEEFYECVAKESLFEAFEAFVPRMAIGLVGEGSECLGFDDTISMDHDWGPGFCIWLNHEDYKLIGKDLQDWYENLPTSYRGLERKIVDGSGRVGVWCMDDFFEAHTGFKDVSEITNENFLHMIPDEGMSCILNGRVFHDPSEEFSRRRAAFCDAFTDRIWNRKIATSLIHLGKYGQYNYPRCMKRGDYVTAQMVLYKYIEELLKFVHYLNHVFPPYYKWLKMSASGLDKLAVLADLTDALADFADGREAWKEDASGVSDKVVGTIEIIAKLIVEECRNCGLFDGLTLPTEELFLEAYGKALYAKTIVSYDK